MTTVLPILFDYLRVVPGHRFAAKVRMKCGALVEKGDDEWWATAVYPGGIASPGDSPRHAISVLREEITLALEDIIYDCESFSDFEAAVEDFHNEKGVHTMEDWNAARARVRAGDVSEDGDVMPVIEDPEFTLSVDEFVEERLEPMETELALKQAS